MLGRAKIAVSVMIEKDVDIVVAFDGTFESASLDTLSEFTDTRIEWFAKPFDTVDVPIDLNTIIPDIDSHYLHLLHQ